MSTGAQRLLSLLAAAAILAGLTGCGPAIPPRFPAADSPTLEADGRERQIEAYQEAIEALQDSLEIDSQVRHIAVKYDVPLSLARPVVRAARAWGHDPDLFARLVQTESSWRPRVVSHKGAVGLTQVLPSTARIYGPDLTVEDLKNPHVSAEVGAWYLWHLKRRFNGDLWRALRAYNAGPTRVAAGYPGGRAYARKVLSE